MKTDKYLNWIHSYTTPNQFTFNVSVSETDMSRIHDAFYKCKYTATSVNYDKETWTNLQKLLTDLNILN